MKAFRKWWDNNRVTNQPHTCQSARGENLACIADEEVWKAALEEALKHEIEDDKSIRSGISDWIRYELRT